MKLEEVLREAEVGGVTADTRRKQVGGYVLGNILGEGSFAKVRLATHVLTREKVAIKIINKRLVNRREYVRKNMRREAVMLQRLRHPNIVRLYEVMETENSFYLVTELAGGGDFIKHLTKKKQLTEDEARGFLRQIVSAVEHMHRSGVIHRDLKIENLLLDKSMNIKIIDLGLSNAYDRHTLLTTQCGSPAYAAPEIFSKDSYGPAVDVWSIGVNLYAMVTGKLPFLVEPPTNLSKLHALILRGPKLPDHVSKECQDLLRRMLDPKPHQRISIREVMLHPWLHVGGLPQLGLWPLKTRLSPDHLRPVILQYMTERLDMGENTLKEAIMHHKPCSMAATYHLLCARFERGLGLPPSGPPPVYLAPKKKEALKVKDAGEGKDTRDGKGEGEEEDRINPLYIPEERPGTRQGSGRLDGVLNTQSSPNYRECLRQLKNQREGPPVAGILKAGSPDGAEYGRAEDARSVSFSDKQLLNARLTPREVERLSEHYRVQSMHSERDAATGSAKEPSAHAQRGQALLQHRKWVSEHYSSPPAPPNSALGYNRQSSSTPNSKPSSPIHPHCLPRHPPAVLAQDAGPGSDDRFYDGYRFKARTTEGERALSWDLKPFRLPSRGSRCESRTSAASRALSSGGTAGRGSTESAQRRLGTLPGHTSQASGSSDGVRLRRLGVSYTVPDHSATLTLTRPRRQPAHPQATAVTTPSRRGPPGPPHLFSPRTAYKDFQNRVTVN